MSLLRSSLGQVAEVVAAAARNSKTVWSSSPAELIAAAVASSSSATCLHHARCTTTDAFQASTSSPSPPTPYISSSASRNGALGLLCSRQGLVSTSSGAQYSTPCSTASNAQSFLQTRSSSTMMPTLKNVNKLASKLAVQPHLPPPTPEELEQREAYKNSPIIDTAIPKIPTVPVPEVVRRVGVITGPYSLQLQPAFAVVEVGGTQFKVTADDVIFVGQIPGVDVNEVLSLDRVMLLGTRTTTVAGRPYVPGAQVLVAVEEHFKDGKVHVFKKTSKKRYKKYQAPRPHLTTLRVLEVRGTELESVGGVRLDPQELDSLRQPAELPIRRYEGVSLLAPPPAAQAQQPQLAASS